jgi:hypothetical protein
MAENKKPHIVTIDEVEYDANEFTPLQARLFDHCIDLDRKISGTTFQLEQLQLGKEICITRLKEALSEEKQVDDVEQGQ